MFSNQISSWKSYHSFKGISGNVYKHSNHKGPTNSVNFALLSFNMIDASSDSVHTVSKERRRRLTIKTMHCVFRRVVRYRTGEEVCG